MKYIPAIFILLAGGAASASAGDYREDIRFDRYAAGRQLTCPNGTDLVVQDGRLGVEEICITEKGVRHGYYLMWHKDGDTWAVLGNYYNGRKHGRWMEFNSEGQQTQMSIYRNGRLHKRHKLTKPAPRPGV